MFLMYRVRRISRFGFEVIDSDRCEDGGTRLIKHMVEALAGKYYACQTIPESDVLLGMPESRLESF